MGSTRGNEVIQAINALLNARIQPGSKDQVLISDSNAIYQYVRGTSTGGGSSGLYAAGIYDTGTDYIEGALVYTAPDSNTRYFWICEIANGPSSSTHAPTFSEPSPTYWRCYGKGGGSGAGSYRFKSMQGEYIVCRSWDGTTEGGSDVNIAKPFKLRWSAPSVTIDGQSVTYSSYDLTGQKRTATCAGASAYEAITPRYSVDDVIWADTVDHTLVTVSGTALTLLDTNRDGRAWARKNDQS